MRNSSLTKNNIPKGMIILGFICTFAMLLMICLSRDAALR